MAHPPRLGRSLPWPSPREERLQILAYVLLLTPWRCPRCHKNTRTTRTKILRPCSHTRAWALAAPAEDTPRP